MADSTLKCCFGKIIEKSEIRFGSLRYVFSILDLSQKIIEQLIIYLVYVISMCFSEHVMTFEMNLVLDFEIWRWIAEVFCLDHGDTPLNLGDTISEIRFQFCGYR